MINCVITLSVAVEPQEAGERFRSKLWQCHDEMHLPVARSPKTSTRVSIKQLDYLHEISIERYLTRAQPESTATHGNRG